MGIPSNTITKTLSGETEKTIITTVKMGDFTMNFVGKIE